MIFYILFTLVTLSQSIIVCPPKEFHSLSMNKCRPLLNCTELGHVKVGNLLGVGGVKAVYNATWQNVSVALSVLNNPKFASDFQHGQQMLIEYNNVPGFVKLIGWCPKPALTLTELHPLGSAGNLSVAIVKNEIRDGLKFRLELCFDWSKILQTLHGEGTTRHKMKRVMCDSNSLSKLLSQILITTDLRLILNDLDALPVVGPSGVLCGRGPLIGDLIAPEQRWPHPELPYNETLMKGYDEKTDIWKAAILCEHFLSGRDEGRWAKYRLFDLHKRCKMVDPKLRPSASEMVQEYHNALMDLEHDEL